MEKLDCTGLYAFKDGYIKPFELAFGEVQK